MPVASAREPPQAHTVLRSAHDQRGNLDLAEPAAEIHPAVLGQGRDKATFPDAFLLLCCGEDELRIAIAKAGPETH